jgi:hypothetical protein
MSILFSFIVFILCSNLYIIVDFCAKSIFFEKKKNLILEGLLPILINFIQTGKNIEKKKILTVPSFVLIFVFIFLF